MIKLASKYKNLPFQGYPCLPPSQTKLLPDLKKKLSVDAAVAAAAVTATTTTAGCRG